jgi:hypothetical protein
MFLLHVVGVCTCVCVSSSKGASKYTSLYTYVESGPFARLLAVAWQSGEPGHLHQNDVTPSFIITANPMKSIDLSPTHSTRTPVR